MVIAFSGRAAPTIRVVSTDKYRDLEEKAGPWQADEVVLWDNDGSPATRLKKYSARTKPKVSSDCAMTCTIGGFGDRKVGDLFHFDSSVLTDNDNENVPTFLKWCEEDGEEMDQREIGGLVTGGVSNYQTSMITLQDMLTGFKKAGVEVGKNLSTIWGGEPSTSSNAFYLPENKEWIVNIKDYASRGDLLTLDGLLIKKPVLYLAKGAKLFIDGKKINSHQLKLNYKG